MSEAARDNDYHVGRDCWSGMVASVVVPVRGRPRELAECLRAIAGQELGHGRLEVIVCDDGTDPPLRADEYSLTAGEGDVVWLSQAPRGPAAARNLGIRAAGSPVVVFVDSDVVVEPTCIAALVGALREHREWVGAEACLDPVGAERGPLWDAPASRSGGHYHTAAIAYRKTALFRVGGFDEAFLLAACEDVDLAARMLEVGPIGFVPGARARHPRRRVNLTTHWKWREHWFYTMVLAVRYDILTFPGRSAGSWPRIRVALAACFTLPLGRAREAINYLAVDPGESINALALAVFDVLVGLSALPDVLFGQVPNRTDYLALTGEPDGEN